MLSAGSLITGRWGSLREGSLTMRYLHDGGWACGPGGPLRQDLRPHRNRNQPCVTGCPGLSRRAALARGRPWPGQVAVAPIARSDAPTTRHEQRWACAGRPGQEAGRIPGQVRRGRLNSGAPLSARLPREEGYTPPPHKKVASRPLWAGGHSRLPRSDGAALRS
jgi:hypothetical protein